MSIPIFGRNRPKLKALLGIRARLVLLVLILVVPLMFDRVRLLEEERAQEVVKAANELSELAKRTAGSQREVISAVRALLKSTAYLYAVAHKEGRDCLITQNSSQIDLPWIRSISISDAYGKVRCSTARDAVGLDLGDRNYVVQARTRQEFMVSDYILSRATGQPIIMAVQPVTIDGGAPDALIIAAVDLKWMSRLANDAVPRTGVSVFLVDSNSVVLGAQSRNEHLIGTHLRDTNLLDAITRRELSLNQEFGSTSFVSSDGEKRAVSFAQIEGTNARLIVSVSEAVMLADIDSRISAAYMQLALFVMLGLIGAWIVGERLIIRPINLMTDAANRFGNGDLSARAPKFGMPWEFAPLASAFNIMASRLAEREREMTATNDRLMVMASVDIVSGLANRRGFQGRLEFEWMKALQTDASLSLMMIDVDHFKMFNDTYGHPEGDACLNRLGEALAEIADETSGYAARYGGEEFCLLLPDSDITTAMHVGEHIRAKIERLAIGHSKSSTGFITVSVGVASIVPAETRLDDDLVEAADAALYAAKRRGRNTVVAHGLIRSTDQDVSLAS